jgi:hypothetical protein
MKLLHTDHFTDMGDLPVLKPSFDCKILPKQMGKC